MGFRVITMLNSKGSDIHAILPEFFFVPYFQYYKYLFIHTVNQCKNISNANPILKTFRIRGADLIN